MSAVRPFACSSFCEPRRATGKTTDVQTHHADGRLALSLTLRPWALALIREL
ncbi:MAG: hypothetical protein KGY99_07440 [Phycisphaerae bacterium]|nr:hypothetical protein [Phycisphaerae bacterium]